MTKNSLKTITIMPDYGPTYAIDEDGCAVEISEEFAKMQPNRDWILTRILWLSGCEKGQNRLGKVDTMQRYIYIHGTPDSEPMGIPLSHGCIRMRNQDLIELFDLVDVYTLVEIIN